MMGMGLAADVVAGTDYGSGKYASDASTWLPAMVARFADLCLPDLLEAATTQEEKL